MILILFFLLAFVSCGGSSGGGGGGSSSGGVDPFYSEQWHLENTGQSGGTSAEDVNFYPAYSGGTKGSGILVNVVDDGLEMAHPDLIDNTNYAESWNFVNSTVNQLLVVLVTLMVLLVLV